MFLPTTIKEVRARGWEQLDVILFSGDAYIDHPAFGAAVIGRLLEAEGYRVAIVPQPNWRDDLRDFTKLGTPRLFFGVTAGAMDSMVNHYTANLRLRSDDAYTPGGKAGFRPDRAVTVYTRILKSLYPNTPVVIGGIEAMPTSLLSPASTITTTLTTSMAVYAEGSAQDDVLWALGLLLMGMSLIFILIIHLIGRKGAKARG